MAAAHISSMLEIPFDRMALSLLRQALNADAGPDIARIVVLRKLAGLYRSKTAEELRDAFDRAWAMHCREHRNG